jgi:hypothetical protein
LISVDVQPVLGTFAAVARPQPKNLSPAFDRNSQRHVDGPVGDRTVTDLT